MTRILVVEHQHDAGSGLIGRRLVELGIELVTVGPDTGHQIPRKPDGFDGVIVLGGSMGPTSDEEAPWLEPTRALLDAAVTREIPTLGICLGAQLLSTATGGRVGTMPGGPEVGVHRITLTAAAAEDPLFRGLDADAPELPVVQWHWLETAQLPEGATLLAMSTACRNQVYRLGMNAWGLQFHPEALGDTAQDWRDVEDLTVEGLDPDTVVAEVRAAEPKLRELWGRLAERFADIAGSNTVRQREARAVESG